jgi:hypothetical protein
MAYIQTIPPWRARGELRNVYRQVHQDLLGRFPIPLSMTPVNILHAFSLRPTFLRAFERWFIRTMWGGELRRQAKEAIAVAVAQAQRCPY